MSAELIGLDAFRQQAADVATAIPARTRGVAQASAMRVAAGIRARVRHAAAARLRAAVRVVEEPEAHLFGVGFDDAALFASGLFPMVPVWHEFGTKFKSANPAVGDAVTGDRGRYENEMRAAVTGVLAEGSR